MSDATIIKTIALIGELSTISRKIALREEVISDLAGKYTPEELEKTFMELEGLYMERLDFLRRNRATMAVSQSIISRKFSK
jgi:hypothetical protein